jgi:hypothetical protein
MRGVNPLLEAGGTPAVPVSAVSNKWSTISKASGPPPCHRWRDVVKTKNIEAKIVVFSFASMGYSAQVIVKSEKSRALPTDH